MTDWVHVDLPGGVSAEVPKDLLEIEIDLGAVTLHRNKATSRTIEYWKTKAVFCALRDIICDEIQEIENVTWDVRASKDVDRAFGASLDLLGRIVGEARDGRVDTSLRVRIKARERINRSQGTTTDLLAMCALLDPATFTIRDRAPASFVLSMSEAPSGAATAVELASLVGECRAAGVGGVVVMPSAAGGFVLGDSTGSLATSVLGDSVGSLNTAPLPDGRIAA